MSVVAPIDIGLVIPQHPNGKQKHMIDALFIPMFAAAGYSFLYLVLGGGLGGALLIFVVAKMLGK